MAEAFVQGLTDSLQKGLWMLLGALVLYLLIIGGLYYARSLRSEKSIRRKLSEAEAKELTAGLFGQETSEEAGQLIDSGWPPHYAALGGVMLPDAEGEFYGIDLLLKTPDHLYLIQREPKGPVIDGTAEAPQWQAIQPKGAPLVFPNPLPRLHRAEAALKHHLRQHGLTEDHVTSLVLFPAGTDLPPKPFLINEEDLAELITEREDHPADEELSSFWKKLSREAAISRPEMQPEDIFASPSGSALFLALLDMPILPAFPVFTWRYGLIVLLLLFLALMLVML